MSIFCENSHLQGEFPAWKLYQSEPVAVSLIPEITPEHQFGGVAEVVEIDSGVISE